MTRIMYICIGVAIFLTGAWAFIAANLFYDFPALSQELRVMAELGTIIVVMFMALMIMIATVYNAVIDAILASKSAERESSNS